MFRLGSCWNLLYFLSYRALVDFIYFKKLHVNIEVFLGSILAFSMEYQPNTYSNSSLKALQWHS